MQGHHLMIQSETSLSRSLSTSQFAAGSFLPGPFGRLRVLLHLRMMKKAFYRFPKVFQDMPAINDLLGGWSAVSGPTLIVFRTISADDFDSWMLS